MESKKEKTGHRYRRDRKPRCNTSCATEYATADLIDVSTMPDEWVPRRGGPILADYIKKLENDETTILQELDVNLTMLNAEINGKIHTLAQNLKSIIHQNQMRTNCVVGDCKPNEVKFTDESRDKALVELKQLYIQRVDEIATFKKEAMAFERTRADKLHELLTHHCHRLVAVGKQPPQNVVDDFDQRAYEANIQLLNNARAYAELEAKLYAQADAGVSQARSQLNQFYLSVKFVPRLCVQPPNSTASDADSGIRGAQGFKKSFELVADKYRNVLHIEVKNFTTQLIQLRKNIENHHDKEHVTVSFESSELREINQEYVQLVIDIINRHSISRSLAGYLYKNAHIMQVITAKLGKELQFTFDILNDAGHLWSSHFMRSALARKLIMTSVEDLITTNDSSELKNEINFDINFEKMRTSPTSHVLKGKYQTLVDFLTKSANLYNEHSKEEIGLVESFMSFHETMVNILLEEVDSLLQQYPIEGIDNSKISKIASSVPREYSSSASPIVLESQLIVSLRNWRNDFLETLQDKTALADGLNLQATRWVDEKKSILNVRYSTKMHSHSIQMERVQAARQMREAELQQHHDRLDSHLTALLNLIKPLPGDALKILSIDSPLLYPFCDWISEIKTAMNAILSRNPLDPEFKKLKMASYRKRLVKHRTLFELSLDAAIEVYKTSIKKQLRKAMHSNVKFISAIKLFSEGGNYSVSEASKTSCALVEVAGLINSSTIAMHEGLKGRRNQLLNAADLLVEPLRRESDVPKSARKLKSKSRGNKLKFK